jgi:CRP/FNR family transcriptional regulator, cyclic AMP receptor protein
MLIVRTMPTTRIPSSWLPKFLREAEVFRLFPESTLVQMVADSLKVEARKGEAVFRLGDPAAVYVLQQGRIEILARPSAGQELQLFVRQTGELFGEASLWLGCQVHEARTLRHSVFLKIRAKGFRAALEQHGPATLELAGLMAHRLVLAEARLGEVAVHSVRERLTRLFSRLAVVRSITDREQVLPERFTQEELGRCVGASRVAVSHALRDLRRAGQIGMSGHQIVLRRAEQA